MHLWFSIPVGLIISIICISGAILSFQTEILEWKYPERYFVKDSNLEKKSLEDLIPQFEKQLEEKEITSIKISSDPKRTYAVSLKGESRNLVFFDPYTGDLTGKYNFQESSFTTVMKLHRWLLDSSRTWGKTIVGVTTILFVFIIISGVIWWFPTQKGKWKSRFTLKTKKGIKRLLYDLHLVLGIYSCIFLLICSLSGLMWSFQWYRNGVNKLFGVEVSENRGHGSVQDEGKRKKPKNSNQEKRLYLREEKGLISEDKTLEGSTIADPTSTITAYDSLAPAQIEKRPTFDSQSDQGNKINPYLWNKAFIDLDEGVSSVCDYSYITMFDGSATVLRADAPHNRATNKYTWDKKTGNIKLSQAHGEKTDASSIMAWAYAIHVGAYGGIITRILTCLACIIGASLPLTGYYIFYRKHIKKKKKRSL